MWSIYINKCFLSHNQLIYIPSRILSASISPYKFIPTKITHYILHQVPRFSLHFISYYAQYIKFFLKNFRDSCAALNYMLIIIDLYTEFKCTFHKNFTFIYRFSISLFKKTLFLFLFAVISDGQAVYPFST